MPHVYFQWYLSLSVCMPCVLLSTLLVLKYLMSYVLLTVLLVLKYVHALCLTSNAACFNESACLIFYFRCYLSLHALSITSIASQCLFFIDQKTYGVTGV